MKQTTFQKFLEEMQAAAPRLSRLSQRKRRKEVIALMARFIASMKSELVNAPLAVYDRLQKPLSFLEQVRAAMERNDEVELDRLNRYARSQGGYNLLERK